MWLLWLQKALFEKIGIDSSTCSLVALTCLMPLASGLWLLQEALFEEIGIDSDKSVKADFEGARALLQPIKKMKR